MNSSIFYTDIEEESGMNKYTAGLILGILGALQGLSQSEASGTVPEILEYDLQGPATIESDSIKTSGTIKSICASYEFDGAVYLEVSANGGRSYTRIINGKPLVDGFIPGNELCFRATIADNSILKKITIGYTDSSGASTLYQNPDLKNYKYRKAIYIAGGSEEVFNYPLKINLDKNKIYFTSADGQTPLYYYLEEQGNYYVKIPQIPKQGTTIYVYYNDVIASPEGAKQSQYNNPNKVFLFFDDFSGTSLDEQKWEVTAGLKKEYNIKGSNLRLKDCMVISRNFKIKQGILEFKAKAENNCSIQAIVRGRNTPRSLFPLEQIVFSSNYPGAEHTIAINDMAKLNIAKPIEPLTYYIYKVTLNQTGIIFERYSENYQKQAQIQFLNMGNSGEGYIGLKADAAPFNAGSVYFDWLRVRPYIEVEPLAAQ
jgi:hypothetical protein